MCFLFLKCSYVICLDSGCLDVDQLWLTSSSRGLLVGYLKVQISQEAIHSSDSGIVRDSLSNQTWRAQMPATGIEGIPDLKSGNVLRKCTTGKLSIDIPPLMDPKKAAKILTDKLTAKLLPFNVNVVFDCGGHYISVINDGNITPRSAHASPPPFSPSLIASMTEAHDINSNDENNSVNVMNDLKPYFSGNETGGLSGTDIDIDVVDIDDISYNVETRKKEVVLKVMKVHLILK